MQISIIIPAFNEELRIATSLHEVREFLSINFESWEIIVVDDGSNDRTAEIVKTFYIEESNQRLILLKLSRNMGKGAAVKAGVAKSRGGIVLFMDADLSTPLAEIRKVIEHLKNSTIVIGSRGKQDSNIIQHQPFYRELMGRIFNRMVRLLVIDGIEDTQCGFKAFRADVAKEIFSRLQTNRFGFDVEVLLWAKKLNFPIQEIGITWINSPNSRVSPIKDSLEMFFSLLVIKRKVNKLFKSEREALINKSISEL
jgi:dolichyl-phosphate beta-glucosyltransferase